MPLASVQVTCCLSRNLCNKASTSLICSFTHFLCLRKTCSKGSSSNSFSSESSASCSSCEMTPTEFCALHGGTGGCGGAEVVPWCETKETGVLCAGGESTMGNNTPETTCPKALWTGEGGGAWSPVQLSLGNWLPCRWCCSAPGMAVLENLWCEELQFVELRPPGCSLSTVYLHKNVH